MITRVKIDRWFAGKRLIMAHPRSGQNYISHVLQEVGLNMALGYLSGKAREMLDIERFGDANPVRDGTVAFQFVKDVSPFEVILHQVRHPLDSIASTLTEPSGAFNLIFTSIEWCNYEIKTHDRDGFNKSKLALPMWTWLYLNDEIEEKADWRYKIEDIDTVFPEICERFGVKAPDKVPGVSRNYYGRPHMKCSWDDLKEANEDLCEQIREKAEKYGYN